MDARDAPSSCRRSVAGRVCATLGSAALLFSAVLAGCGSDKGGTAGTTQAAGAAGEVRVTLAKSFTLTPETTTIAAGTTTFVGDNTDEEEHEIVVLRTDLAPDKLPFDETSGKVDEEAAGVENVGEVELKAGGKGSFKVDLVPGTYVLICNLAEKSGDTIESHYHEGMYAGLTVT